MATATSGQADAEVSEVAAHVAHYVDTLAAHLRHDATLEFNLGRGYRATNEGLVRSRLLRRARIILPEEYDQLISPRMLHRLRDTAGRHVLHMNTFRSHTGLTPQAAE
jgi:hypothetical protein